RRGAAVTEPPPRPRHPGRGSPPGEPPYAPPPAGPPPAYPPPPGRPMRWAPAQPGRQPPVGPSPRPPRPGQPRPDPDQRLRVPPDAAPGGPRTVPAGGPAPGARRRRAARSGPSGGALARSSKDLVVASLVSRITGFVRTAAVTAAIGAGGLV